MKDFLAVIGGVVAVAISFIGILFLAMLGLTLAVFFGWLAGCILCWFAGGFIVAAITSLLGIFGINAVITVSMIPYITAALAFFGHFFKSTANASANFKKKND